jgi:hypothetical protein
MDDTVSATEPRLPVRRCRALTPALGRFAARSSLKSANEPFRGVPPRLDVEAVRPCRGLAAVGDPGGTSRHRSPGAIADDRGDRGGTAGMPSSRPPMERTRRCVGRAADAGDEAAAG